MIHLLIGDIHIPGSSSKPLRFQKLFLSVICNEIQVNFESNHFLAEDLVAFNETQQIDYHGSIDNDIIHFSFQLSCDFDSSPVISTLLAKGSVNISSKDNGNTSILSLCDPSQKITSAIPIATVRYTLFFSDDSTQKVESPSTEVVDVNKNRKVESKFLHKRQTYWSNKYPTSFEFSKRQEEGIKMQTKFPWSTIKETKSPSPNVSTRAQVRSKSAQGLRETRMNVGFVGSNWPKESEEDLKLKIKTKLALAEQRRLDQLSNERKQSVQRLLRPKSAPKPKTSQKKNSETKNANLMNEVLRRHEKEIAYLQRQLQIERDIQQRNIQLLMKSSATQSDRRNSVDGKLKKISKSPKSNNSMTAVAKKQSQRISSKTPLLSHSVATSASEFIKSKVSPNKPSTTVRKNKLSPTKSPLKIKEFSISSNHVLSNNFNLNSALDDIQNSTLDTAALISTLGSIFSESSAKKKGLTSTNISIDSMEETAINTSSKLTREMVEKYGIGIEDIIVMPNSSTFEDNFSELIEEDDRLKSDVDVKCEELENELKQLKTSITSFSTELLQKDSDVNI